MHALYDFLTGPALWFALIVFFGGLLARGAFLVGLSLERDRVFWNHLDAKWSLKSIFFWLLPLGSRSLRQQPLFGLAFWVFHVCLLAVPIFLGAHNIMWEEAFGWSLPTLPNWLADWGAVLLMAAAAVLLVRRVARPEVRILSGAWDYAVLLLTAAPFATGFIAYHQYGDYLLWLNLHILAGELMLVVVPFSKLGHLILFFFTRAFIGSDMGARRAEYGREGAHTW
jgi:nitrate reductase gamma subunit